MAHPMFQHDQMLRRLWLDRMERGGFFFYQLRRNELDADTRFTTPLGSEKPFCVQFNRHRGTQKRRGVAVTSVRQPFDPSGFNFLQVKLEEVLFILPSQSAADVSGGDDLRRGMGGYTADGTGGTQPGGMTAMISLQGQSPHLVVINASPIEQMHCLFCPRTFDRLPQQLTPDSVEAALAFASLSRDPSLRMGFNSLGAAASVNHLHFHVYRLAAKLPLECSAARVLRTVRGGTFAELVGYPIPGFVFQFAAFTDPGVDGGNGGGGRQAGRTKLTLLQLLHCCTAALQAHGAAHNLCITANGRNVFVFPRTLALGVNQRGGLQDIGCMEMMGHFIAFDDVSYRDATHTRCAEALAAVAAPLEVYEAIRDDTLAATGFGTKLSML